MDDEHNDCNECNGAGSFAPVYFGEREAPDSRERERCEDPATAVRYPATAREYSFHAFIARGDSFAAGDIAGTSSEDAHARATELWGCDAALIDSHPSTECRHRGCAGRTRDGR